MYDCGFHYVLFHYHKPWYLLCLLLPYLPQLPIDKVKHEYYGYHGDYACIVCVYVLVLLCNMKFSNVIVLSQHHDMHKLQNVEQFL